MVRLDDTQQRAEGPRITAAVGSINRSEDESTKLKKKKLYIVRLSTALE